MLLSIFRKPAFYVVLFVLVSLVGTVYAGNEGFTAAIDGFGLTGAYSIQNGQPTAEGSFGGNQMRYPEGSCIPALITIENGKDAQDINFELVYSYHHNGNATEQIGIDHLNSISTTINANNIKDGVTNLNQLSFSGSDFKNATEFVNSSGSSTLAAITGPFSGNSGSSGTADSDTSRHYNINLQGVQAAEKVYLLTCAQLGPDAGTYPGSSMQVDGGHGGSGGKGSLGINPSDLIKLPDITITNSVNGSASPDQWVFNVSPSIGTVSQFSIPAGSTNTVFSNIGVDGVYTISTSSVPVGYVFDSVNSNGTNCVFTAGSAQATVASGATPTNAVCNFYFSAVTIPTTTTSTTSTVATSTITVSTTLINDDGGTAQISDFLLQLDSAQITSSVAREVSTGTHQVGVSMPTDYTLTFGGDCDTFGSVTVTASEGDNKVCDVIFNDVAKVVETASTGTVHVVTNVNGGTYSPENFTVSISGNNPSTSSFPGVSSTVGVPVVMSTGTYDITTYPITGYTITYSSDCSGTLQTGDNKTCTITWTFDTSGGGGSGTTGTSTLRIFVTVDNTGGGEATSTDALVSLTATNASTSSFPGSADGTNVVVDAGSFSVMATTTAKYYSMNASSTCMGTAVVGQTLDCTIAFTYIPLEITNVALTPGISSLTLTWDTNHPASTRAVWDTVSHEAIDLAPVAGNYGYPTTTVVDENLVIKHSAVVNNLLPGTRYFLRPVSHGSPEITGPEMSAVTLTSGGGGSGSGGGSIGGSGSLSTPVTPVVSPAPQAILGEKIEDPAPQAVLGLKTLPETGTDSNVYWPISLLGAVITLLGLKLLSKSK